MSTKEEQLQAAKRQEQQLAADRLAEARQALFSARLVLENARDLCGRREREYNKALTAAKALGCSSAVIL